MWLSDTSIKRPIFATMLVLVLVVLGIVSYPKIGVDLMPKVDFPMVSVTTQLKGASSEIMDIDVTDKVEEAVNTINGVKTITSTSSEGNSVVSIEFVLERDIDLAVQDVREKVALIRRRLPGGIEEPVVGKVDPDSFPVLHLALYGKQSIRDLSTYADEVLKEQIQKVSGVGAVRNYGLRLRQARVWLDGAKMNAYSVTANDVIGVLRRENVELPGGRIESNTKEYSIKVKGTVASIQQFENMVVGYNKGAAVKIRDIGRVEDSMDEIRSIARYNGANSVSIGIQKQSGTNTVEVVEKVKKELDLIRPTLPEGINLVIASDQSDYIKRSINDVQHHLIYGGIFAILAVFLFLKNVRTTLIAALAIPTSIISTFAIMNAFNFTFNNMSMLALSLSIGILVDDAIIVIENIHRHMEEGMSAREAASFAVSEIGLAVSATTLAIIVIFIPVAFMKGMTGRFFFQFGMTVVFAIMVSWFVSFTLTPMMSSLFLKHDRSQGAIEIPHTRTGRTLNRIRYYEITRKLSDRLEFWYEKLEAQYRRVLTWALSNRRTVITLAVVIFLGGFSIAFVLDKELVPSEDQSKIAVRLTTPIDYSMSQVDSMCKRAEDVVRRFPEVTSILYNQGGGRTDEINKASMTVNLVPKSKRSRSQNQIKMEMRRALRSIPGLRASVEDASSMGGLGGGRQVPIQYSIRGRDLGTLQKYSNDVMGRFSKVPGVVDVDSSLEIGKPEIRVYIDRDKAAALGVDVTSIAETINMLIGGEVDVTQYKDESKGRSYDLRMRLISQDRIDPEDIRRLYVRAKDGRMVELSNLISLTEAGGSSIINRVDRRRAVTIFANLEGKALGDAKKRSR
ncbi:MAG TPA: efflux RND transporter permease subunit [Syntrophorhabdaceae bacterium]|nr:efflux RND transporter permease subunit [Syntrophorhabdaceae bacterium]